MRNRNDEPRVLLITAASRRHRYAARQLARDLNLIGVVSESKPGEPPLSDPHLAPAESAEIRAHFKAREEAERRMLGDQIEFPEVPRLAVGAGEVNNEETSAWVRQLAPDLLLLYGSSIIKPPLLATWEGRIINLHLGLSPYYRGSGTNFWPLVNRQPELVGATIHLATPQVDGGAILAQVRPLARPTDGAHELGVRTIIAGLEALADVADAAAAGRARAHGQDETVGQVYRLRDFNAAAVRTMRQHFATGMMEEYMAEMAARQRRYPIIEAAWSAERRRA
ncbi:MAG: formyl transferase [Acidobacteriota bacterium]